MEKIAVLSAIVQRLFCARHGPPCAAACRTAPFGAPLQGPFEICFYYTKNSACLQPHFYVRKVQNCGNPIPFSQIFRFSLVSGPALAIAAPAWYSNWHKGGAAAADQANQEESCMIVGIGTGPVPHFPHGKGPGQPGLFFIGSGRKRGPAGARTGGRRLATAAATCRQGGSFAAGGGLGGFSLATFRCASAGERPYHLSGTAAAFAQKLTPAPDPEP